jgi:GT2 family glycosyltransferase
MNKYRFKAWYSKYLHFLGILLATKTILKPIKDLEKISNHAWLSLSDDPHFWVKTPKLNKGWYLLYIDLGVRQFENAKLYPVYKNRHLSDQDAIELPLKPHKKITRYFYLEDELDHLRFDPLENQGEFTVKIFRLVKVPQFYAQYRQLNRVQYFTSDFNQKSNPLVKKIIHQQAKENHTSYTEELNELYANTFSKAETTKSYQAWLEKNEKLKIHKYLSQSITECENKPLISILLPTYNTDKEHLKACIKSVLNQSYENWELCIVDDASTKTTHIPAIHNFEAKDNRIKFMQRQQNGHISQASNDALDMASGQYILLLDHDDELSSHALLLFVDAINKYPKAKLFYADEDKIDEAGFRFMPHFKPDWNPDLLYSQNYIGHPVVYETIRLKSINGFTLGVEGSQDHDLLLRYTHNLTEEEIVHLPWVLYHWRATENSTSQNSDAKDYTTESGIKALQSYFDQNNPGVTVSQGTFANTYRCKWPLPKVKPLVSLLIPTRDGYDILKTCIQSILEKTTYKNYEILVLNNQTSCKKTLNYLQEIDKNHSNVRVLDWNESFNYSAINNFGVKNAYGEMIGLINNDIEVISEEWLTEMVSHAVRPDIGCVGAKLYYPNDTIQHAGVVLGIGGVAGHSHKYFNKENPGYYSRLHLTQNYSAVTAACLLVKKSTYNKVNGLNEKDLTVAFNDVDFCLKVRESGYRNLFTPWAELYHHESISRGNEDTPQKQKRAAAEVSYMKKKWLKSLQHDTAYNRNLTQVHENFALK